MSGIASTQPRLARPPWSKAGFGCERLDRVVTIARDGRRRGAYNARPQPVECVCGRTHIVRLDWRPALAPERREDCDLDAVSVGLEKND